MEIYLRPMQASDAADYAEAVNESLAQLQPRMVWAHKDYQPQEAAEWFSWLDRQREKARPMRWAFCRRRPSFLGAAGIRYAQNQAELSAIGYWVRKRAA